MSGLVSMLMAGLIGWTLGYRRGREVGLELWRESFGRQAAAIQAMIARRDDARKEERTMPLESGTIEQEWQRFAAAVFRGVEPPSETQREEMRRAFYAGGYVMLCAMGEVGQPHVNRGEAVEYFTHRRRECEAFFERLIREHAEGK